MCIRDSSKAQDWEKLPQMISDDILEQFAVIGTYDKIGQKLLDRFGHVITDCEFSIAVRDAQDRETLKTLAALIQSDDESRARKTIMGDQA